jgi:ATP-dependent RNA helicase DDX49/DBP8
VAKILTQVSVTKREQEIKLDETDFDEKKLINKRKRLIAAGMDPTDADEEIERVKNASNTSTKKKKKRKTVETVETS